MLKEGRLRAFRNLPIGWVTHANHARDLSERLFHHVCEGVVLLTVLGAVYAFGAAATRIMWMIVAGILIHTAWWIINGNCHVCLLDSFKFVKNAGIGPILDYICWTRKWFVGSDRVAAILVYGSFCRRQFHGRSDLDLRVIRKSGLIAILTTMPLAVAVRIVSLVRGIPTDLQVVDNEEFLLRQMRASELPVCVFGSENLKKIVVSVAFDEVLRHPDMVLKDRELA